MPFYFGGEYLRDGVILELVDRENVGVPVPKFPKCKHCYYDNSFIRLYHETLPTSGTLFCSKRIQFLCFDNKFFSLKNTVAYLFLIYLFMLLYLK